MNIRWFDNIFDFSGYAHNVRSVAYELYKLGVDIKCICPKGGFLPERMLPLWSEGTQIDSETIVVGRIYADIHLARKYNPKMIAGMMVLEGNKLPESWVAKANCVDQLWATSTFNRDQFIKNGIVEDKIKVIPHGIDPTIYHMDGKARPEGDDFTFLFVGGYATRGDRKGADLLAKAFSEEFKPTEKARMIFKINKQYNPNFDVQMDLMQLARFHPKVTVLDKFMDETELAILYRDSDVGVCPTFGEGYGMTMAESMACGAPVIATNYSGHLDFTLPEFSYLIDVEEFVPASYGVFDITSGTNWAKPSVKHLKELMRYCFDNQDEVRKKGKKASEWIIKNQTWKLSAEKTLEAISTV